MPKSRCILLIQLGTPDSLDESSIKNYLDEFLMDPGTISIPYLLRYVLVKWIIVPKRTTKVIERYRLIWDEKKGSPLAYHSHELTKKLQNLTDSKTEVRLGMLNGTPKIETVLEQIEHEGFTEVVLLPLFPHETPATTEVVYRRVNQYIKRKKSEIQFEWFKPFFTESAFIEVFSKRLNKFDLDSFDQILFSFHGLPMKQIKYKDKLSGVSNYIEACELTASLMAKKSGLSKNHYSISYQSRFGKNWTSPQTEDVLDKLASQGKSVLIVSPSFTADCLETSWEIGIQFKEKYSALGGGKFDWLRGLNSDDDWVNTIFGWIDSK